MNIGILGGSFDPVHYGHLNMAKQAMQEYSLDEVWMVPAGHSPNKDENQMTNACQRMVMCELAVKKEPNISVCGIEVRSKERSYTYRTLEKLNAQFPMHQFFFIMGADSLDYLDEWKHPEIIGALAIILVVNRDHFAETDLQEKIHDFQLHFPADIRIVHCKKYNISSHEIRGLLSEHKDVSALLPKEVFAYISEHQLYQK